ncbi:hypothetical protein psyc5s11_28040 [Clostridium gelidum]|uniref:DUF1540 domain-containing protein n=1 Tax=Clostridium gelidum TaxID=704125 RepID=A0ABN6IXM1_9CLOT|nr:DUF1540 domain-containing protein [Clostridium gelidum]BCZ46737.1 hypothetical protein psyc5s11_28040 [Clostridium gelidum]
MQQINCDINNCSHNKSGICYSSRANIGGINVLSKSGTWCDSFSGKYLDNIITNNTNTNTQCDYITCEVENCIHNTNTLCNLQYISISETKSSIYAQTRCSNFYLK